MRIHFMSLIGTIRYTWREEIRPHINFYAIIFVFLIVWHLLEKFDRINWWLRWIWGFMRFIYTWNDQKCGTIWIADASFKQSLPGHVRAPAVFKCHRVSAIGNGEDEFAYLATVHISGHVFKGFLYDHGVDGKTANVVPCVSELQLGNNCSGKNRECSSAIAIGVANNNAYPASASWRLL